MPDSVLSASQGSTPGNSDNMEEDQNMQHLSARDINQQLSSLSEEQAIHPELPRDDARPVSSDSDSKSIYIGNVDYEATEQELLELFGTSGPVERVNIMKNKATGAPKGFAYLEFVSADSAPRAVTDLDGTLLRDRELKVSIKRTNVPGMSERGRARGRARGIRGIMRGRARGIRGMMKPRAGRGTRFSPY